MIIARATIEKIKEGLRCMGRKKKMEWKSSFWVKQRENFVIGIGAILALGLFGTFFLSWYQKNATLFPRASYVLEKYVESHDTHANSSERFLQAQIDVAETNSGEDIAVHPLFDNPDGKTFYFHVNADFSYHQVDRDQTVFVAH